MSHLPNWMEYGKPVVDGQVKTAVEAHDKEYGTYSPKQMSQVSEVLPTKLDPKPFGGQK
jgi:hypothetical protein